MDDISTRAKAAIAGIDAANALIEETGGKFNSTTPEEGELFVHSVAGVFADGAAWMLEWIKQQGYAVVPVDPTVVMLNAGRRAPIPLVLIDSTSAQERMVLKAKWSAMIAAAGEQE